MIYFTADQHFYHENIIKYTKRPFNNAEDMNKQLIQNWNDKISADDEIYILGDFTMKGAKPASGILSQLKGKKHLIRGNHDKFADSSSFDKSQFASIRDYAEIVFSDTHFILFHYPIVEWNGFFDGSISLHGHLHNQADYNYENRRKGILRYDAGVDANYLAPVSAEDIISFFNV